MVGTEVSAASIWIPVITLLLGFGTGQVADWFKEKRTYRREMATRAEQRKDARSARYNAFQSETLLSLQEPCLDVIRGTMKLHDFDVQDYKENGRRTFKRYPADVDAATTFANARTAHLGVRVADAEVRRLLQLMKDCGTKATLLGRSIEEAMEMATQAGRAYNDLNIRIGVVLREMDAEDLGS